MAVLTGASPRKYQVTNRHFENYPMDATTIYDGAAVTDNGSGQVENLNIAHGFVGFANQTAVNAVAGSQSIEVYTDATLQLVVTGATSASTGATVYATDNNTFTTTSTSALAIGKVVKIVSGTTCLVKVQSGGDRSI